ncbi:trihelix transcription factor ASIL2 [Tripterygium wilfordii]|uniref:Trihelix transcription factor ASIL2 n=1 Tax=Tripterygium wilfordii TaxID=458696 RepID=A0A7J7CDZ2_TRIWF|nr:trihelix transcription factor ASIL2-like [Tripterygium wilfordii]KAF5732097.1 trihelix transcription factor ASIL2 [Tripterygium wilfordii]
MEDEEEIQSHDSGASGSPPNGRITVTVAAAPPHAVPQSSAHNTLTLALPVQNSNKNSGGGGGGGREDCWSEGATAVLIEAWGERYLELSRGNLKQKHWKEVADIVSGREEDETKIPKTDIQCKNRIDTVKKKYKSEKAKIADGGGQSKWVFFERLDHLIGPTAKIPAASAGPSSISMSSKVPVAIPVGVRGSGNQFLVQKHQPQRSKRLKNQKLQLRRRRGQMESEEESSEEEDVSPDSDDSLPPEKKPKVMRRDVTEGREKKGGWGNSLRLLTQEIVKFGEAYEAAESAKLQQVVEIEKRRMKFAKDLELQRMQFFMKTHLEISQMKHGIGRRGVDPSNHHYNNNNNSSDSNHHYNNN